MRASDPLPICSPVIGATRIPATAASAPPAAQFTVPSRSGDQPSAAAERSSSAAATVAKPNRENLNTAHSSAVISVAIASSSTRSDWAVTLPQCHRVMRNEGCTSLTSPPQRSSAAAVMTVSSASVAMTRTSGDDRANGRMMNV